MVTEVRCPNVAVEIWEAPPFAYYDEEGEEDYSAENPEATRILERVRSAFREGGVSDEEIGVYTQEATSRCYNHLVYTTTQWVQVRWVGPDYEVGEE